MNWHRYRALRAAYRFKIFEKWLDHHKDEDEGCMTFTIEIQHSDFPNGFAGIAFELEMKASALGEKYGGYSAGGTSSPIVIVFTMELTPAEIAILDAVIQAHSGVNPEQILVKSTFSFNTDPDFPLPGGLNNWVTIGGAVVHPDEFTSNVLRLRVRVRCAMKTTGNGAGLRLFEEAVPGSPVLIGSTTVPDSEDIWVPREIRSEGAPQSGVNTYFLQAKLGSADWGNIRFVSMDLIEFAGEGLPPG